MARAPVTIIDFSAFKGPAIQPAQVCALVSGAFPSSGGGGDSIVAETAITVAPFETQQVDYRGGDDERPWTKWMNEIRQLATDLDTVDRIIVCGQSPLALFALLGATLQHPSRVVFFANPRFQSALDVSSQINRDGIDLDVDAVATESADIMTYGAVTPGGSAPIDVVVCYVATNPHNRFTQDNYESIVAQLSDNKTLRTAAVAVVTKEPWRIEQSNLGRVYALVKHALRSEMARLAHTLVVTSSSMDAVAFMMGHEATCTRNAHAQVLWAERMASGKYELLPLK